MRERLIIGGHLKLRRAICLLLAVCCACCFSAFSIMPDIWKKQPIVYEGEGFLTPEDAVLCYLDGLKNLDLEQMLSAFAWETQAEHYSVEQYFALIRARVPTAKPRIPADNRFIQTATLHSIRSRETELIYNAIEAYLLGETSNEYYGKAVPLQDDDAMNAFLQEFDVERLEKLSRMTNIRFLSPDEFTDGHFSTEQIQSAFAKQTAPYCADEVVNLVAMADLEEGTLLFCPTAARYGDRWYLVSCNSMVQNIMGVLPCYLAFAVVKESMEELHY